MRVFNNGHKRGTTLANRSVVANTSSSGTSYNRVFNSDGSSTAIGNSRRDTGAYNSNPSSQSSELGQLSNWSFWRQTSDGYQINRYYADQYGNFHYDDSEVPYNAWTVATGKYKEEYDRQYAMYQNWYNSASHQRELYEDSGLNSSLIGSAIGSSTGSSAYNIDPASGNGLKSSLETASQFAGLLDSGVAIAGKVVSSVCQLLEVPEKRLNARMYRTALDKNGAELAFETWSRMKLSEQGQYQSLIDKWQAKQSAGGEDVDGVQRSADYFVQLHQSFGEIAKATYDSVYAKLSKDDAEVDYQYNVWKRQNESAQMAADLISKEAIAQINKRKNNNEANHNDSSIEFLKYDNDGFNVIKDLINGADISDGMKAFLLIVAESVREAM